ncbi:reductive dehalogenase [Dehalobacter sp. 14DCB1]|uniref:reductive dehalogenase n=1 Tax=Dehalobacter sp. 14DCB1 TaxID=2070227 RepID=UPI001042F119|nr:reductive dehalogenase [Dehalobacter sp. 14DCB1]TCX53483.1 reductive dehalogenase [Dehalobacter sp. 14DCB1]
MSKNSSDDRNQQQGLQMNRRKFLKAGAAAAVTMGLMGTVGTMPAVAAEAAVGSSVTVNGARSKLKPTGQYGSASVKFATFNNEWLGTTKLVGEVKNISEAETGFSRAGRGLYGKEPQIGRGYFIRKDPAGAAEHDTLMILATEPAVQGKVSPVKLNIPDPEQMSQNIKDFAYFLRADEVGIGKMPDFAWYSHKVTDQHALAVNDLEKALTPVTDRLPYVIVVMVDQNLETMLASTGYDQISGAQSFLGYHTTGVIAVILANYIRNLGYNARAHHARNYKAVMTPCLISAGLGELSRTGDCSIHPRLGFRHKVAAVTTDIPLMPDQPIDFGLQDFCRVCKKCADNCPSGAITQDTEPIEYNGYLRWNSNMEICTKFRTTNKEGSSCGRCMKVCPWNTKEESWFHAAGVWIGSHGQASSKLLKGMDDMFGYGTEQIDKYKWWLEWPEMWATPEKMPGLLKY